MIEHIAEVKLMWVGESRAKSKQGQVVTEGISELS